jgi:hypothetical protein
MIKHIRVVMSPSVAQQHPDNQFSIQKRAGHFDKKYKYGDAAKRYPLVVPCAFNRDQVYPGAKKKDPIPRRLSAPVFPLTNEAVTPDSPSASSIVEV